MFSSVRYHNAHVYALYILTIHPYVKGGEDETERGIKSQETSKRDFPGRILLRHPKVGYGPRTTYVNCVIGRKTKTGTSLILADHRSKLQQIIREIIPCVNPPVFDYSSII